MKKRAFTLIEILVVVVVVSVLATMGLPYFQNVIENSREQVCDTNLQTLQRGVELYMKEQGTVPGSLSELSQDYLDKAYAQVMQAHDSWKLRLAYLIVEGPQWGLAYAQGSRRLPYLRCPSNPNTAAGAISYGLNKCVVNLSSAEYKTLAETVITVADSETPVFYYTITSLGGCSGTDTYDATVKVRGHKKFNILSSPETYLKGEMKNAKNAKVKKTEVEVDDDEEEEH